MFLKKEKKIKCKHANRLNFEQLKAVLNISINNLKKLTYPCYSLAIYFMQQVQIQLTQISNYQIEMLQRSCRLSLVSSLETKSANLLLELDKLLFLGAGGNHLVYQNLKVPGQVIIFKIFSDVYTQMEYLIYDIMEQVHESIIKNHFPILQKVRWEKSVMYIQDPKSQETNDFFTSLQNIFNENFKEERISSRALENIVLDRNYRKVKISTNIFKAEGRNTILEFKMKTVLPNIYSQRIVQQVSHKANMSPETIKQILKNKKPAQKSRWFIKNMEKINLIQMNSPEKDIKNNQVHENPVNIFGIEKEKHCTPNFIKTKLKKILPVLNTDNQQLLNSTMFNYIHSNRSLLQSLHAIQSVFEYSPNQVDTNININLLLENSNDMANIARKLETAAINLINQADITSLDKMYQYLIGCDCISKSPEKHQKVCSDQDRQYEKLSRFLLFLIVETWKDISFVFRAKFDGNTFQHQQIFIIDDYLRNYGEVAINIKKNREYLNKVVRYFLSTQIL